MSWKRGIKDTDFELSRVQDWIEDSDIMLEHLQQDVNSFKNWMNIRIDREEQRDMNQDRRDKNHNLALAVIAVILALLTFFEGYKQVHDHTLIIPSFKSLFNEIPQPVLAKDQHQDAYY